MKINCSINNRVNILDTDDNMYFNSELSDIILMFNDILDMTISIKKIIQII